LIKKRLGLLYTCVVGRTYSIGIQMFKVNDGSLVSRLRRGTCLARLQFTMSEVHKAYHLSNKPKDKQISHDTFRWLRSIESCIKGFMYFIHKRFSNVNLSHPSI